MYEVQKKSLLFYGGNQVLASFIPLIIRQLSGGTWWYTVQSSTTGVYKRFDNGRRWKCCIGRLITHKEIFFSLSYISSAVFSNYVPKVYPLILKCAGYIGITEFCRWCKSLDNKDKEEPEEINGVMDVWTTNKDIKQKVKVISIPNELLSPHYSLVSLTEVEEDRSLQSLGPHHLHHHPPSLQLLHPFWASRWNKWQLQMLHHKINQPPMPRLAFFFQRDTSLSSNHPLSLKNVNDKYHNSVDKK